MNIWENSDSLNFVKGHIFCGVNFVLEGVVEGYYVLLDPDHKAEVLRFMYEWNQEQDLNLKWKVTQVEIEGETRVELYVVDKSGSLETILDDLDEEDDPEV